MSVLKWLLPAISMAILFFGSVMVVRDVSFKAGKQAAAAECSADAVVQRDAQLERLEEIAAEHSRLLLDGQAAAREADQELAARFEETFRKLEKLRAQPIEVRADCRRDYDAVRLYQQAASGSSRDRDGEATPPATSPINDPVPSPGDAGGN